MSEIADRTLRLTDADRSGTSTPPGLDEALEGSEADAALDGLAREAEPVDAMPVLAEARTLVSATGVMPAVQAAAVAATGFVAGAATLALVRRHSARRLARGRRSRSRGVEMLPVVGSRTFVVDVHLLGRPGE